MKSLTKLLLDTFYFLRKDYGTTIQYTKVGKGDVDPETGVRDNSADRTFPVPAVLLPTGHTGEWLARVLGRVEKVKTQFIIRASDIPVMIETGDYFVHGNLKYWGLEFTDLDGVVYVLSGGTFT